VISRARLAQLTQFTQFGAFSPSVMGACGKGHVLGHLDWPLGRWFGDGPTRLSM